MHKILGFSTLRRDPALSAPRVLPTAASTNRPPRQVEVAVTCPNAKGGDGQHLSVAAPLNRPKRRRRKWTIGPSNHPSRFVDLIQISEALPPLQAHVQVSELLVRLDIPMGIHLEAILVEEAGEAHIGCAFQTCIVEDGATSSAGDRAAIFGPGEQHV